MHASPFIHGFHLFCSEVIREPMFWVVATASGLLGLAISFSSVWFLHQTGPTTYRWDNSTNLIVSTENVYMKGRNMHSSDNSKVLITFVLFFSLVGSLNKIPISVAGILLFNAPVSVENFCSIVFGKNLFHLCCFSDVLLPCYILMMPHFYMFSPGLFAGIFFAKAKMS